MKSRGIIEVIRFILWASLMCVQYFMEMHVIIVEKVMDRLTEMLGGGIAGDQI